MITKAVDEATAALYESHPNAVDLKIEISEFSNEAIAVIVYGVVDNE